MPMPMSLALNWSCHVGPLFLRAWTIETCGQYYFSLAVIALVCFLRHLLTMYKTRLILRLPEAALGASRRGRWGRRGLSAWDMRRPGRIPRSLLINTAAHRSDSRGRGRRAPGHAAGGLLLGRLGALHLRVHRRRAPETRYVRALALALAVAAQGHAVRLAKCHPLTAECTHACAVSVEQGGVAAGGNGGNGPSPPRSRLISEDALSKLEYVREGSVVRLATNPKPLCTPRHSSMAHRTDPTPPHPREPICLRVRLVLTGYFAAMGTTSLLVMLLAMSFNVGIILAILVGEVGSGSHFQPWGAAPGRRTAPMQAHPNRLNPE